MDLNSNRIHASAVVSHQKRTKAQLWISGLLPSAYWCGQALVDVSLYSLILLSMYLIFYLADMVYIHFTSPVIFALVSNNGTGTILCSNS